MDLDPVQRSAREQFSRQSHHYGAGHTLEDVDDVRAALTRIGLPPRGKVLDVATGAGHTALLLASLGHDVIAADIAQPMLDCTAQAAAERGLKVEIRLHPAEQLPYADATFDLVTCRVAAHHFSSPWEFIQETERVLKTGGSLLLIDRSVQDDEPEAEAWLHMVEKLRDPSHHRLLSPRGWGALCATAGLNIRYSALHPALQPDLDWYFETAATPPENREQVRQLVKAAPASARRLFELGEQNGKIVWWWQRLTLIARKP